MDRGAQGVHSWPVERLWWLEPTVSFWWYAIFILYHIEGHNLHYAVESIIHEPNSSQNSKTRLFDPTNHHSSPPSVHQFLLSAAVRRRWIGGPQQLSARSPGLSSARARSRNADASFIREVSSHRRCGLAMISGDYGWLMVGKYIRNHRLREGGGGFHSR